MTVAPEVGSGWPGRRGPYRAAAMAAPTPTPLPDHLRSCTVVLVRTQGPVNLGMIARLCGNLGITDLRLVAPRCEIDCEDARKFAVHARDFLLAAPVFPDLASAVHDCGLVVGTSARVREAEAGIPMLPEEVPALLARRPAARWAIVFGNEADGLNEAELERCQAFVRLRTFGDIFSYNLSHAVAITLYQIASVDAPTPERIGEPAATRAEVDHLYAYWMHSLERFGYFRRTTRERFAPQLQRLMNHLHLSRHDVQMLWGMFAQFHYRTFGNRAEPGHDPAGAARRAVGVEDDEAQG